MAGFFVGQPGGGGVPQGESLISRAIEGRIYPVTPSAMTVKATLLSGEVVDLKVIEVVEPGTDRVISPARLTGSLRLENISVNRTVRLIEGKIRFMDVHGWPIELEGGRTETIVRFTSPADERLDPGQDTTRVLEVEFPVEALKAERLKEIRLELAYIPSPFREEVVNFVVSIGAGQ
jgi:hypothetical protein